MTYTPWDALVRSKARQVKVIKDLSGGVLKVGDIVYAFRKFQVFKPDPDGPTPPVAVAKIGISSLTFDEYFEEMP